MPLNKDDTRIPILILTGQSGAGLSTAMKALEDIGYHSFDNYPVKQIESLIKDPDASGKAMAFACDTRGLGFSAAALGNLMEALRGDAALDARLIVLQSSDAVLQRRFSETRRVHPMAKDRPVIDGIIAERQLIQPLFELADRTINTSDLSVHDLKRILEGDYALTPRERRFQVEIVSFGFKKGTPRQVDMLFDVRFLRNPHWDLDLRDKTGLEGVIQEYIREDEAFDDVVRSIQNLLNISLPRMMEEGRSYVTIAVGCTGGKHRSVFIAQVLADGLAAQSYTVSVRHRDLPHNVKPQP